MAPQSFLAWDEEAEHVDRSYGVDFHLSQGCAWNEVTPFSWGQFLAIKLRAVSHKHSQLWWKDGCLCLRQWSPFLCLHYFFFLWLWSFSCVSAFAMPSSYLISYARVSWWWLPNGRVGPRQSSFLWLPGRVSDTFSLSSSLLDGLVNERLAYMKGIEETSSSWGNRSLTHLLGWGARTSPLSSLWMCLSLPDPTSEMPLPVCSLSAPLPLSYLRQGTLLNLSFCPQCLLPFACLSYGHKSPSWNLTACMAPLQKSLVVSV